MIQLQGTTPQQAQSSAASILTSSGGSLNHGVLELVS